MNTWIKFSLIPLGLGLGLAIASCKIEEANPEHCLNADGDLTCAERYGDERPYCVGADGCEGVDDNYGCVAELPPEDCYFPCGSAGCDDETETGTDDATETDTDTDTTETDTGPECMDDDECTDAVAPFCSPDGACVDCSGLDDGDAACADLDPTAPLCLDGACVQCSEADDSTCEGTTPICDLDTNTCVPCSSHEQCPNTACNFAAGGCFENVVYVDGDHVGCGDGDGSQGSPYCDIAVALGDGTPDPLIMVAPLDGDQSYQDPLVVNGTVAIFGDGGVPILQGASMSPAITVGAGSLILRGVTVTASPVEGIAVNGQAWIESSSIVNNTGGGIVVNGGQLVLTNSFVGSPLDNKTVVDVPSGTAQINYCTLAGGGDFGGDSYALACGDATVDVRNSILVKTGASNELACDAAQIVSSALESPIGDNVELGQMPDASWFDDYANGDLHLSDSQPEAINTAAVWLDGDPATDIDGDPRPSQNGASDYAGADVP